MLTVLCILLSVPPGAIADNSEQLQRLRDKIHALETSINATKRDRSDAYNRLVEVERQLNRMHRDVRKIDRELANARKTLNKSRQAQVGLKSGIGQQRQSVAEHVRTAYLLGSQAQIKLLLNQHRVDDVSRSMAYYRYLTGARAKRIESMQTSLEKQQQLARQTKQLQQRLDRLREKKRLEAERIDQVVQERKQLLATLDSRLQQSGNRMRQLREDERRLQHLVERIEQENRPPITPPATGGQFALQKQRLQLPVRGRIIARFGHRKNIGDQRWNGLFIAASSGQNVSAVYGGRVVFASWLHGFGMLMILDHGEGYMTLYGHNRSLYKVVGDWVNTGETIASIGNTGNPPRTGLYFGVRQSGKPRNPLIWCKTGR